MTVKDKGQRVAIVAAVAAMEAQSLNVGTAGNISVRVDDSMLITPSGVPCELMRPEMIAAMPVNGEYGAWRGPLKPSSEWRFHLDIMRARPDVGAIVHFHPTFGSALAMLNRPILAAHYMIALFGGAIVKCTKYAPFGTKELADLTVEGLGDRHAVLLGNHGALTTGHNLHLAMLRARELENLARMYYYAIAAGKPAILSDEEIRRTVERFKSYGASSEAQKLITAPKKRTRGKAKTVGPKKAGPKKATAKKKTRAAT
jgi:L-fuculose-phosphate aldolase